MGTIYVGSARIDENGNASGGRAGDQKQTSAPDYRGEVSQQQFYVHSKGWYILRPKSASVAEKLAKAMVTACNNSNLGYDQSGRNGVIKYGINTKTKTECDCSSLVRACIIDATGKDVGNFSTASEVESLEKSGLFEKKTKYVSQSKTPVYNGDVLVTCTKGHTVIVTNGNPRVTPVVLTKYKLTGNVNIRAGAGTQYRIIRVAHNGEIIEVSRVSENNWGYIPKDNGWISLNTKYTVKI